MQTKFRGLNADHKISAESQVTTASVRITKKTAITRERF